MEENLYNFNNSSETSSDTVSSNANSKHIEYFSKIGKTKKTVPLWAFILTIVLSLVIIITIILIFTLI